MADVPQRIAEWRDRALRRVVESKYADYTAAVIRNLADSEEGIRTIGALGSESRTSGDDSPCRDVWEEFKAQIQGKRASSLTSTSKWNKVEHRLFSFISSNWRGEPLRDYDYRPIDRGDHHGQGPEGHLSPGPPPLRYRQKGLR